MTYPESPTSDRKQLEAEFHDQRERDRALLSDEEFERRYSNNKFYSVVRTSKRHWEDWVRTYAPGRVALDYCCGLGGVSLELARAGATVHGIDISSESVQTATRAAEAAGLADRAHFQVMDAENLTFPDQTFDIIICSGVLHHLDVDRAYPQLARVLKPTGRILCIEALGYNPAINLYRKLTPHLRTEWEAEHILTLDEVRRARTFFQEVDVHFYHLATIAAVPFRDTPVFRPLLSALETIDGVLLKVPYLQRMAWQMIFELRHPRPLA